MSNIAARHWTTDAPTRGGLSDEDCKQITSRSRSLPGEWTVRLEVMDDGWVFARLIAPWVDVETSTFLLERERNQIVLTDRLSSGMQDYVSRHANIDDALNKARTVVLRPSEWPAAVAVATGTMPA